MVRKSRSKVVLAAADIYVSAGYLKGCVRWKFELATASSQSAKCSPPFPATCLTYAPKYDATPDSETEVRRPDGEKQTQKQTQSIFRFATVATHDARLAESGPRSTSAINNVNYRSVHAD